jgi:hypothetical protein
VPALGEWPKVIGIRMLQKDPIADMMNADREEEEEWKKQWNLHIHLRTDNGFVKIWTFFIDIKICCTFIRLITAWEEIIL